MVQLTSTTVFQKVTTDHVGAVNNVVTVRQSDFEVFEALACDGGAAECDSLQGKISCFIQLYIKLQTPLE